MRYNIPLSNGMTYDTKFEWSWNPLKWGRRARLYGPGAVWLGYSFFSRSKRRCVEAIKNKALMLSGYDPVTKQLIR